MPDLSDFDKMLDNLDKLTDEQREILLSRLSNKDNEKDRKNKKQGLLKNDSGEIISCPHCGSVSVKKHGTKDYKQRYRCKDCNKTFSETTGTSFRKSRLSEWQWREILKGMILNLSIPQIADATGLSNKTVWLNKNKVMQLITDLYGEQDKFRDIVECDETEVHLSYKGKRDARFFIYHLHRLPRHHRNREEKIEYLQKNGLWDELLDNPELLDKLLSNSGRRETSLDGSKDDSVCIITGTDRSKNLYIKPTCIGKLGSKHVAEHFENRFEEDAIIVTDSSPSYDKFANDSHLHHEYIPSGEHTNGPYSLSRVNAVHSKLSSYYSEDKRNLPATKHLTVGVDFFWWLEKNKDKDLQEKIDELFQMLLDNGLDLTYDGIVHRKLAIDTKGLIPNEV